MADLMRVFDKASRTRDTGGVDQVALQLRNLSELAQFQGERLDALQDSVRSPPTERYGRRFSARGSLSGSPVSEATQKQLAELQQTVDEQREEMRLQREQVAALAAAVSEMKSPSKATELV